MPIPWAPTLLLEQSSGDQSYPAFFVLATMYLPSVIRMQTGRALAYTVVALAGHCIDTFPNHAAASFPSLSLGPAQCRPSSNRKSLVP